MSESPTAPGYLLRAYDLPTDLEDRLSAALWRAGALGCEIKPGNHPGRLRLEAWFDAGAKAPDVTAWPEVSALDQQDIADRDWLADYRARSQPFDVGERFRLDPRDEPEKAKEGTAAAEGSSGRVVLHVPAENAFGTGSHESTRLMLEWLERMDLRGCRVLDVGTGSGILAFAAGHLGAASIVGYDMDVPSVLAARRNARRNAHQTGQAKLRWLAGRSECLQQGQTRFDLLLVNVLPERIESDLPRLTALLSPGGRFLSSGNLLAKRELLLPRFQRLGLELEGELTAGEWLSFLFRLPSSPSAPTTSRACRP